MHRACFRESCVGSYMTEDARMLKYLSGAIIALAFLLPGSAWACGYAVYACGPAYSYYSYPAYGYYYYAAPVVVVPAAPVVVAPAPPIVVTRTYTYSYTYGYSYGYAATPCCVASYYPY